MRLHKFFYTVPRIANRPNVKKSRVHNDKETTRAYISHNGAFSYMTTVFFRLFPLDLTDKIARKSDDFGHFVKITKHLFFSCLIW